MSSSSVSAASEERRNRTDRPQSGRAALERAIVQAVAYADVFEYPLTADEIHRYLVGVSAARGTVRSCLNTSPPRPIIRSGRYFTLAGRESAIETRRARARTATDYWHRAVRYGHTIGKLPFVRMVAVTGGLAMDNMSDGDIDYLIITQPGRLWLCRALIIGLVRMAAVRGTELCPNYFLSEHALVLTERNLFTAHEVTQMVPLAGMQAYQQFREVNRWTETYLPNAVGSPRRVASAEPAARRTWSLVERTLASRVGTPLERWEMSRKIRKLSQRTNGHVEAAFGPDWCKGHFGDHGQLTLARYEERLRALDRIAAAPVNECERV